MTKFNKLRLQYWDPDTSTWIDGQPTIRRKTRKEIELVDAYRATWFNEHGNTKSVVAPAGYTCDLSSIPRIFHTIVPKVGLHDGPSVIHDICYETLWRYRLACDVLFLEAMKVVGVRFVRRQVIFAAVRAGGWVPWRRRVRRQRG